MRIERLHENAWERLRSLRLAALAEAPDAFGSTYEDCARWPAESWREQLRDLTTFVAIDDGMDVGLVRSVDHPERSDAVYLISMWVSPAVRRRGIGRALIDAIVDCTRDRGRMEIHLDVRDHK